MTDLLNPNGNYCIFFMSEQDNSKCLVCSRVIAGQRKFTIERHYNTLHKEFDDLTEEERKQKVVALKSNVAPQSEDGLEEFAS